ncbi:hypothetical protein CS063_10025 [Sporanaerobium hydrogeniformans]|uniref:Uncharacterized protein n=1 Tax=Sporanaerobium hydrogeniformans TaxID=3072179 RepID=A0AC61DCX7_9FIRM|nr:C39 family peptidase [Sporanaerobium hydrogeniformans]PHV70630.1 hypothetical protein CS063_10025 [Sporanaerobium hydrogeniformans]
MKRLIVATFIIIVFIIGGVTGYYLIINNTGALPTFINVKSLENKYQIKKSGELVSETASKEEAITQAKEIQRSIVVEKESQKWIYSTLDPFLIITDIGIHDFPSFNSAFSYAVKNEESKIFYNNDKEPLWEKDAEIPNSIQLNVKHIRQYPELPRGCEVTSLAMLFSYYNKDISKMELAKKVKKDTTPYSKDTEGRIYYGNPYEGFVGDMYNINNNGYGVYHGPITELINEYLPNKALDITGMEFNDVLYFLSKGYPIWVIINATYEPLEEKFFNIWHTPTGIVKTTSSLHSVVITGYDLQYIYINDPLDAKGNKAVNREKFIKAWEQMGNQAITILR